MARAIDADALMEAWNLGNAKKYGNITEEDQAFSYDTMFMYEIADMIEDAPTIEAEPVKQEWISVNDRLPEKMEWVLCACRGNIIEVLRYDHIMDDWDTTMPNRGYFKNFVTHWMPLPEPPKEE